MKRLILSYAPHPHITPPVPRSVVLPSFSFGGSRQFAPWFDHAENFLGLLWYGTTAGQFVVTADFALIDGFNYHYPIKFFPDWISALTYTTDYMNYVSPTGARGFLGEWFNYVARPLITERVLFSDWADWLKQH